MGLRRLVFLVAALVTTAAPAGAPGWRSYHNERFGTTADVPAAWRAGAAPENGDGLMFTSPDGRASVTVSGNLHIWDTIGEAMTIYETPEAGETITYKHREKRAIVVSGTGGDRIFYERSILSCHDMVWNTIWIEYPAADKREYDALVTHIARSLKPGPSEQVAACP